MQIVSGKWYRTNYIDKMTTEKQFELLDGLPPYGPMYISVSTDSDEPFFSEGYVLRLFKSDGSNWVANFRPGWTNYYKAFDFPDKKILVVIAGGQGYLMSPDDEKPKFTFGLTITEVLKTANGSLICADNTRIIFLDNSNGQLWVSERISWDGIKDLKFSGDILSGTTYDPTNSIQEWCDFSINLKTKEITGGSYTEFLKHNPHLEVGDDGMLNEKETTTTRKKPWWKIW
jgi:hypothetical protein